jgi:hypothetical protein
MFRSEPTADNSVRKNRIRALVIAGVAGQYVNTLQAPGYRGASWMI